ncbi:hypothetical protein NDU88_002830 [Pleurodeles waltl]|uniref:Transposase Helix-turn-helix domain-containing protein n=1 Tax=Pleurodeles waltl TaxID=8319 RepID=A0AAV7PC05_PLEWA|nr:hypothetical protein NDU88_002830 [Pleurodeles waltl]
MQGRRTSPKNDLNTRAPYLSNRAKILHGREAESENDTQPELRKKITPGSGQALKWGQTHQYLMKTHRSNSRAPKVRHGGAFHPACTQTQSTGPTTAASTTPAGTSKATQKAGEDIPHQDNPLGLPQQDIIQRYRLNWQAIQQLLHNIEPQLAPSLQTPHTIPPETKLLAVLHMLASGSFQTTGALVAGISQPSFSAFLPKVLDAIISLTPATSASPTHSRSSRRQNRASTKSTTSYTCLVPLTAHMYALYHLQQPNIYTATGSTLTPSMCRPLSITGD